MLFVHFNFFFFFEFRSLRVACTYCSITHSFDVFLAHSKDLDRGEWYQWTSWTTCSTVCSQNRQRSCKSTCKVFFGHICPGERYQTRNFTDHKCADGMFYKMEVGSIIDLCSNGCFVSKFKV